jgi:hypothetical protein
MAHLACLQHKRRVMVTNSKAFHRSDNSSCDSKLLKIGTVSMTPATVTTLNKNDRGVLAYGQSNARDNNE